MADNVNITPGTGATVAADEVGGILFQRVKIAHGADGVADDVTSSSPLPVVATGAAAHDAAIAGNPVRIGARAISSNFTAVATGDAVDLAATLVGAQIVRPFSIPEADWSYAAAAGGIDNSSADVTVKAAPAAGLRNYVTGISIEHDTLGAATQLLLRDGSAGTVLWRGRLQTTANEGTYISFPSPLRCTAATALIVHTLAAVTGGVYVNAQGFVAP